MGKMGLVVLASGRGSNLQAILDWIGDGRLQAELLGIISDNKDAFALTRGKEAGVATFFADPRTAKDKGDYDRSLLQLCRRLQPDYICLAGYMRLLGKEFIESFPNRIINIHPSLLPGFSGLNAQKQAFDYGVKVTGCTVHFVDHGMDTGPVIAQRAVPVLPGDDLARLTERILAEEHRLYPEVLRLLQEDRVQIEGRKVTIRLI